MDHRCDTKEQRKRNENVDVEVDHRCDTKEQRKRNENVERWIKVVTLRNTERERGMRMIKEQRERGMVGDTKEQRERGIRMLRIKGVTLRNTERRNDHVEVDQGVTLRRERERGMRMLRWIIGVTLRNREREE